MKNVKNYRKFSDKMLYNVIIVMLINTTSILLESFYEGQAKALML